jgi:hypothetical protein
MPVIDANGRLDAGPAAMRLTLAAALLSGSDDPIARGAALSLCIRAAELHVIERVRPVLSEFPATIQEHFATAASPLVSTQDAFLDTSLSFGLLDLLEMCSDQALSCITPRLYRGWQDRNQARRDARRITTEAVGFSLDAEERDGLLMALAVQNRLFAVSPPLDIDGAQIGEALAAVQRLLDRLAPAAE